MELSGNGLKDLGGDYSKGSQETPWDPDLWEEGTTMWRSLLGPCSPAFPCVHPCNDPGSPLGPPIVPSRDREELVELKQLATPFSRLVCLQTPNYDRFHVRPPSSRTW